MSSWHSYSKVYNLGHAAIRQLLSGPVTIEEKVDGSQFSFGVFNGKIKCRSKGMELVIDEPEKMFIQAVESVKKMAPYLRDGWTYRAEYLQKPKHNALAYDRIPSKHLILFDIATEEETYLTRQEKEAEADRIGLEVVPSINVNPQSFTDMAAIMGTVSILGGQKIEGIVIKNYEQFTFDKKIMMGKHVSEAFKEVHKNDWKKTNPGNNDVLGTLGEQYKTKARWNKAIQHLKERGQLEGTPKDIGSLMKEVQEDIKLECSEDIKTALYEWALPKILRMSISGLPDWYKEELLKKQFEGENV